MRRSNSGLSSTDEIIGTARSSANYMKLVSHSPYDLNTRLADAHEAPLYFASAFSLLSLLFWLSFPKSLP